jgi:hypothetical protein
MNRNDRHHIIAVLTATASLLFLGACATETSTTVAGNNMGDTEMERVLVNSGFRVMTAQTDGQRRHLTRLPDSQFQQVVEHGTTYYLYADKRDHRLYVGDQYAYRAYLGYLHNKKLRDQGVFVWEVRPADRANNKTVEIWNGGGPFPPWSRNRPNDQSLTGQ